MSPKKIISSKTKTKDKQNVVETEIETETAEEEIVGPKAKKTVDIEAALEPAAIIDEKVDDDAPTIPAEDSEDAAAEEISLDDEELNPFGDKWEQ